MTRIWRYVLANDSGFAPCVDKGVLTLACCKPFIRRHAQKGDWIVGYFPKRFGLGRVAWVGRVSEKIPLGQYEKKYRGRRDAIYRLVGHDVDGKEILQPLSNKYHPNEGAHQRDTRGVNAIICKPFCYWGGNDEKVPPEIADMAYYFIGQTTRKSSPERFAALESWLKKHRGVCGTPRNASEPPSRRQEHFKRQTSRSSKC